jgi:hypothetical protein
MRREVADQLEGPAPKVARKRLGDKITAKGVDDGDAAYVNRLRRSMRGALNLARRRQAQKQSPVVIDITLEGLIEILRRQDNSQWSLPR